MKILNLLIFLALGLVSCHSDYTEETLIQDIEKLRTKKIISQFSKERPVEAEQLSQTILEYVYIIKQSGAKRIPFNSVQEGNPLINPNKTEREGYIYIDKENNFVASITYKFTTLQNGRKRINFIDFRNTMGLNCLKYPLMLPIKCIDLPDKGLPNVDSLNQVYPQSIAGVPFYHNILINENLMKTRDSILAVITFNNGNLKIKNNLPKLLDSLDAYYGKSRFIFAETVDFGEPTINVRYDPKYHPAQLMESIKGILTNTLKGDVRLIEYSADLPFGRSVPRIDIGGTYSERVKVSLR